MRARMAIAASRTPVRLREILLRDKPEEMLEASPKGTVPVLVTDDGVIDESIDVMHWALTKNDPQDWLKHGAEAQALIRENDGPFKHHLDRYKYSNRYENADAELHRNEGAKFLQQLEERLSNTSYLFGAPPSLADIAIFPFIRQFRIANMAWFDAAPFPHLQAWLKSLMEGELVSIGNEKIPVMERNGRGNRLSNMI